MTLSFKFVTALSLLLLGSAQSNNELFAVHGSGTTNPSKCFWLIMGQLMDQARDPIHLTYRAVGSSTGILEFVGQNNTPPYTPFNDFGSGDIPVPTDEFNALQAEGHSMFHLPFALGAISIFHSIPGVPSGEHGLNLTSCLIAKIFRREIVYWDNAEILDVNPNLKEKLPSNNYPIKLAHRVKGSSSTASVTAFINVSCPEEWSPEWVGSTIDWPEGDGVLECEGSGGMTDCIRDNPGTIGYIDSGHGHAEGLKEIELENKAGTYISSKRAAEKGGIASAADNTVLPSTFDQDFGHVDFLYKDGEFTWPIVAMSYVYVRKNVTYIDNPIEQGLLIAFLESIYDEDIFAQCTQFGFTPAPESVRDRALAGVEALETSPGTPKWTFETSTDPGAGQGPYVLSVKRRSYAEFQRTELQAQVDVCEENLDAVTARMTALADQGDDGSFTDQNQTQLTAALAMASISMVLWALLVAVLIIRRPFQGGGGKAAMTSENGDSVVEAEPIAATTSEKVDSEAYA